MTGPGGAPILCTLPNLGLRIAETAMLDIGDWRPDLGELGKVHVRFGMGSRGRGPKTRLVPCIDDVDGLLEWWLVDVRHQFGDDWTDLSAPLLPSEQIVRGVRSTKLLEEAGTRTISSS